MKIKKAFLFFRKHGIKATIAKIFDKILKKRYSAKKYSTGVGLEKHHKKYQKALLHLNKKYNANKKIKVAFIVYGGSNGDRFSEIYKKFSENKRFTTVFIVIPFYLNYYKDKDRMISGLNTAGKYYSELGIEYIYGYDQFKDKFLNIYKIIRPDIVFFDNPYDWNHPYFSIVSFPPNRVLSFFVPYGYYLADNMVRHFSQKMMKLVYMIFSPSPLTTKLLNKYSPNNGVKICQTFLGYPKITKLLYPDKYTVMDTWKIKDRKIKRIIWAPHHLALGYSNFLEYKDFMVSLANKYAQELQICFKPHPYLYNTLISIAKWAKQDIDAYYTLWSNMPNTQLETRSWKDLFLTSDAMIMDSISFMAEYSLTGKPACFTIRLNNGERVKKFNEIGEEIFQKLYHASNEAEIINFIEDIVINENDYKKAERDQYIKVNYIGEKPEEPAQNVVDYITNLIKQG